MCMTVCNAVTFLAIIMVSLKLIGWNCIWEYCMFMYCNCHMYQLLVHIDRSDTWHPSAGVRTRDTYDSYSRDGTWQGASRYEEPYSWISPTHHCQLPTTRQSRVCKLLFFFFSQRIIGCGKNLKQVKWKYVYDFHLTLLDRVVDQGILVDWVHPALT